MFVFASTQASPSTKDEDSDDDQAVSKSKSKASAGALQTSVPLPPPSSLPITALQVVTTRAGDGVTRPKRGDRLTMHYTGRLAQSGRQFDSSRERARPFDFTLGTGEVIAAWDTGVAQMTLGQRALLRVPSALGYGAHGVGDGLIPPHADLEFDVELLAINGRRAPTPAPASVPVATPVAAPTTAAVNAAAKPAPVAAAAAPAAAAPAAQHESAASPAPAASAAVESTVLLTRSVMSNAALFELD